MRKPFDYDSLTYESRVEIHNALASTTMKHIDANQELFSPLRFDPAAHPSQLLETVHLHPVPTSPDEKEFLANAAAPELYPFLVDEARANRSILASKRRYLENGDSVHTVVSPHLKMDDLPEHAVAEGTQMDEDHWQDQNGEIISRGVSTIGAFGMAASEVIEKGGHVFMSFPRTKSIEQVKVLLEEKGIEIDIDNLINTNNTRMRDAIKEWKGQRLFHKIGRHTLGKSLQIAWEGSTPEIDRTVDGSISSIALNPIGSGTYKLIKEDYVLPVVLWSDPENPILRYGPIQKVHSMDDVENIHRWQAATLARALGLSSSRVKIKEAV